MQSGGGEAVDYEERDNQGIAQSITSAHTVSSNNLETGR